MQKEKAFVFVFSWFYIAIVFTFFDGMRPPYLSWKGELAAAFITVIILWLFVWWKLTKPFHKSEKK